jgi:hypothetical protein
MFEPLTSSRHFSRPSRTSLLIRTSAASNGCADPFGLESRLPLDDSQETDSPDSHTRIAPATRALQNPRPLIAIARWMARPARATLRLPSPPAVRPETQAPRSSAAGCASTGRADRHGAPAARPVSMAACPSTSISRFKRRSRSSSNASSSRRSSSRASTRVSAAASAAARSHLGHRAAKPPHERRSESESRTRKRQRPRHAGRPARDRRRR